MEVRGQLHVPAASPARKNRVLNEAVAMLWKRGKPVVFWVRFEPTFTFFFCLLRSQLWFILMSTYIPCRVLKYSDFVICVSHLHQSLATICCDIDKESVHLAGDEAVLLLVKSCGWHFHIITETKGMVCVSWARGWRVTKLSTLQSW